MRFSTAASGPASAAETATATGAKTGTESETGAVQGFGPAPRRGFGPGPAAEAIPAPRRGFGADPAAAAALAPAGPRPGTGKRKKLHRGPAILKQLPEDVIGPVSGVIIVALVWAMLEIGVQPWSRADSLGGTDSSSLIKGALSFACLLLLVVAIPPRTRFPVPLAARIYLVFTVVVMVSAPLLDGSLTIMIRAGRVMVGIAVVIMLLPLLKGRLNRFLYVMIGVHAGLALSVVAGLVISPGQAWLDGTTFSAGGRLMGAIMPMMPPRVGEIGAVLAALALLFWAQRRMPLLLAGILVAVGAFLVVYSRTRTAPTAALVGLLLAALLSLRSPGGKRLLALIGAGALAVVPFLPSVIEWATRGQSDSQLEKLSGRTHVWDFIVSQPVTPVQLLFGRGLGEKRILLRRGEGDINYMAIDNSWLDAYWETGLIGLALVVAAVICAVSYAIRTPDPGARAIATFLCGYVLVASVSESGLCDLSSMTLLLLAAIVVARVGRQGAGPHLAVSTQFGPTPQRPQGKKVAKK